MLVDFKHLFVSKSFELEIWHTYYQHRDDFMTKNFMVHKQFFSPWEGVKVGSSGIVSHNYTCQLVGFKYLFVGKSFELEI